MRACQEFSQTFERKTSNNTSNFVRSFHNIKEYLFIQHIMELSKYLRRFLDGRKLCMKKTGRRRKDQYGLITFTCTQKANKTHSISEGKTLTYGEKKAPVTKSERVLCICKYL